MAYNSSPCCPSKSSYPHIQTLTSNVHGKAPGILVRHGATCVGRKEASPLLQFLRIHCSSSVSLSQRANEEEEEGEQDGDTHGFRQAGRIKLRNAFFLELK